MAGSGSKCGTATIVAGDQLRSARCGNCDMVLSPDGRIVTFRSFLTEQRKLREGSELGPLTVSETATLTNALSDFVGDPRLPDVELNVPEIKIFAVFHQVS